MFSTPLIWFSRGAATVCSSTSAEAPGYTARTVTTGGAISGYCAIGSVRIDARPASTRNIERTAAKIGRSIKKRENMQMPLLLFGGLLGGIRLGRRDLAGLGGIGGRRLCDLDWRARAGLYHAIHDYLVSGLEAAEDNPVLSGPVAYLNGARFDDALGVDGQHDLGARTLQHGALWNRNRGGTHAAGKCHAGELPGT